MTSFLLIMTFLLFVMSSQAKMIYGRDLEYVSGWYPSFQMLFLASLGAFENDLLENGWMGTANCNIDAIFFRMFLLKMQNEWRISPEK